MASKSKKFQKQNSLVSFLAMISHRKHISNRSGIGYLQAPEFLKKLRPCVDNDTILGSYYSFIYPYFTYCVHVWGKTYRSNLDCIITLQKRVIRILAGIHPLTHTEPSFSRLKILKFIGLVDYHIGKFMHKLYHRDVPKIFENYYIETRNIHDHDTRQINYIHIAHADTNRRNVSMAFQGGKVWNLVVKHKIPYNESIYVHV